MDSNLYKEILGSFLFPFIATKYDFNCILHQDGDPKHNSQLCTSYLLDNNVNWVNSKYIVPINTNFFNYIHLFIKDKITSQIS